MKKDNIVMLDDGERYVVGCDYLIPLNGSNPLPLDENRNVVKEYTYDKDVADWVELKKPYNNVFTLRFEADVLVDKNKRLVVVSNGTYTGKTVCPDDVVFNERLGLEIARYRYAIQCMKGEIERLKVLSERVDDEQDSE